MPKFRPWNATRKMAAAVSTDETTRPTLRWAMKLNLGTRAKNFMGKLGRSGVYKMVRRGRVIHPAGCLLASVVAPSIRALSDHCGLKGIKGGDREDGRAEGGGQGGRYGE